MDKNRADRRTRIAQIVAMITVLCAICALALAVCARGRERVAFNTAQLVFAGEGERAWRRYIYS